MPIAALALMCAAAVPAAGSAATHAEAYWLDMKGLDYEGQITALCLQGIANRNAPKLFLDTRDVNWPWPPSDENWREYLEKSKGYHFTVLPDLAAAIAKFKGDLFGLAIYDATECDAERSIACTCASIHSCLPVSAQMLAAQPKTFEGLAIKHDWRGKFKDVGEACVYASTNIMPKCTKGLCYSLGHSFPGTALGGDGAVHLSLDYVVAERGYVFNLSPIESKTNRWYGKDWADHPDQATAFTDLVVGLGPLTQVWGWAEPEGAFSTLVSKAGGFVMCPGPNLSFWRKVPAGSPRLPTPPRQAHLEDKCYVVFQTNEGDTPKELLTFFSSGWLDKNHGSQPVAWGINPLIGSLFPALFEYVAKTATPNDSFFCGVSGAGYCFPDLMPRADLYYKWSEKHCRAMNVPTADVWSDWLRAPWKIFEAYHAGARYVTGFTSPPSPNAVDRWLPDGTPVISAGRGLHYYSFEGDWTVGLAKQIRLVSADMPKPCFICVYGGVGPQIYGIVHDTLARLGEGYEALTMDDFMALARETGRLVESVDPQFVARGEKATVGLKWYAPQLDPPSTAEVSAFGQKAKVRLSDDPAQAATGFVAVPNDATLGPQPIVATHGADRRSASVTVVAEAKVLFDSTVPAAWEDKLAKFSIDHGRGRVFCPPEHAYGSVELLVTVDFDRDPVIQISVSKTDGAWAFKLNDGTFPDDPMLVWDTGATGTFTTHLAGVVPQWHGTKTFHLILFSVGAGKSLWVDRVRLLYQR